MVDQTQAAVPVEGVGRRRKAVVAATIGNFVEWYDFSIYAYFATVIAVLFFPSENQVASLLATFASFGVAFLFRPLGALIFGHYGDKIGRKNTLAAVVLLMAGATVLIGVLPTHAQVGVFAPALLVVARALQGLSAGGEYANATSYLVEYAPENKRGLYGSWAYFTIGLSLLAGALLGALMSSTLSEEALSSWGWRIPFLISAPLGLVGFYLRRRLEDSPSFRAVQESGQVASAPLITTLRTQLGNLLMTVALVIVGTAGVYIFLLYMPSYYSSTAGLSLPQALTANVIGLAVFTAVIPPLGALSDRVGRKPLMITACVFPLVLTYPLFLLISGGTFASAVAAQVGLSICVALWAAVAPTALVEIFPTKVRASSLAIGYSVAVALFGGFSPLIVTYLQSATGNSFAPAFYVIGAAAITLVAAIIMRETAREPLRDR
jgi:MHS family proline/betaine transporter-like MFS transporter